MKSYVGTRGNAKPVIFEADNPSKETYPNFDVIYGPFRTREDAERYVKAMDQGVACSEG